MKTRHILAGVVGATMALTLAGAAFAFADNTDLTQTGTAITAQGFDQLIAITRRSPVPGEVAWHFIFNGNPGP